MNKGKKEIHFDIDTILETLTNVFFFLGGSLIIIFFLYIGIGLIIYGSHYIPPDKDIIIRIGGLSATLLLLGAVCFVIYSLKD